jgi:hypothetical protein
MAITVISGNVPVEIGQLATPATANFDATYISSSYSASYFGSSTTASLREGQAGFGVNGINVLFYSGSEAKENTSNTIFINDFPFDASADDFAASASEAFNATASVQNSATVYSVLQGVSSAVSASTGLEFSIGATGSYVYPNVIQANKFVTSGSTNIPFTGATLVQPEGSGIITGSFGSIYCTSDALITVSGSVLGEASFNMRTGTTFTPASASMVIEAITVNNPQGEVVAS